jgi:hypothetical protein
VRSKQNEMDLGNDLRPEREPKTTITLDITGQSAGSDEMPDADADRFRKQAEQARQHAIKANSPLDKEAWLKLSEEWLKLAQSIEDRG